MTRHPQRQRWWWWALMGLIAVGVIFSASSTTPTEGTSDERLFSLAAQLKCQQCVGESVAQSQSPSAVQFREEIAAQMARGNTDDEILNFFAESYDDVLLTPPSTGLGALVWMIPVVALAVAVLVLALTFRRWRGEQATREVTPEEQDRVAAALRARHGSETDGE